MKVRLSVYSKHANTVNMMSEDYLEYYCALHQWSTRSKIVKQLSTIRRFRPA
jgi:hypothetical protein